MRSASTVAVLALVSAVCLCASGRAQTAEPEPYRSPWRTPWDYAGARGAEHWSQLDSAYSVCNAGRQQSPVDIRETVKADRSPLRFVSVTGPTQYVINNGHTIRVNYRAGNGDSLVAEGRSYELAQIHFHSPAEETVAGTRSPMEVHLMYSASDGAVAGVTVFLTPGRTNAAVATILDHMPRAEGQLGVLISCPVSGSPAAQVARDWPSLLAPEPCPQCATDVA